MLPVISVLHKFSDNHACILIRTVLGILDTGVLLLRKEVVVCF